MEGPPVLQSQRWISSVRTVSITFILATGIVLGEALLYFGQVQSALFGHLAVLLICMVAPLVHEDGASVYQAALLVPVFRLATVGIPVLAIPAIRLVFGAPTGYVDPSLVWLAFVYAPFVPGLIYAARYNPDVELDPKWRRTALLLPLILVLGAALAVVEYSILRPEALFETMDYVKLGVVAVVMIGMVGLVEELLFRSFLQGSLEAHLGSLSSIVVSSAVFAAMYSVYRIPELIGFGFGLGLILGVVYYRTRSLLTIVLIHGILNTVLYGVIPLTGPWVSLGV